MTEIPGDIKKLTFEKAMQELEEIVDNLESGNIDLDKSIEYYTRGSFLRSHCQNKLDDAVMKLEEIQVSADGKISKKDKIMIHRNTMKNIDQFNKRFDLFLSKTYFK